MFNILSKYKLVIILLIILGIFLRFYQLNFEDYWYDEMVSFWVSDPNIAFQETILRQKINNDPALIRQAPVNTPVSRLDETKANRELDLRWRP